MKNAMLVIGLFFGIISGVSSYAAQTAKVIVDSASVHDKPQAGAAVVGTVPKDTSISVSNSATNGFYKSRTSGGVVGWISANDLLTAAPAAAAVTETTKTTEKKTEKEMTVSNGPRILLSGGLQILNNTGFPVQIPITGSKTSYGGTAEAQFKLSDMFYVAGRVDYFTGSSTQVISAASSQTFAFKSIPIMAGLIYSVINKPTYRVSAGLYVGTALATSLKITQTGIPVQTYTISNLTEYLNVQSSYALSSQWGILGEVGYRLQTAAFPADAAIGAAAFTANLGGIVARLGVEYKL